MFIVPSPMGETGRGCTSRGRKRQEPKFLLVDWNGRKQAKLVFPVHPFLVSRRCNMIAVRLPIGRTAGLGSSCTVFMAITVFVLKVAIDNCFCPKSHDI